MAKVVKFPGPAPEKFGLQRVGKKAGEKKSPEIPTQLPLFSGARIVKLNRLTTFEEALLEDEHGNFKSAKALYQKAISEGESMEDAYCNLGIIESEENNTAKAIDCFTKCLKLDPRHFEAHYNLANLYAEVGNYTLAKFHYRISIEIEPAFPNNYFNLGLTMAISKEFEEAVKLLYEYKKLSEGEDHAYTDELIRQLTIVP
ncbi:MAG: tetratricopeptide repeat protein [Cyclobacteriaceae bacterium]